MAKKKPQSQPQPEPRLPNPDGNWKQVTREELEAYLEKKLAPQLTLKLSVVVAEDLVCVLEQRAEKVIKVVEHASLGSVPINKALEYAKVLRAMTEKLKRACAEWHKKNPKEG